MKASSKSGPRRKVVGFRLNEAEEKQLEKIMKANPGKTFGDIARERILAPAVKA